MWMFTFIIVISMWCTSEGVPLTHIRQCLRVKDKSKVIKSGGDHYTCETVLGGCWTDSNASGRAKGYCYQPGYSNAAKKRCGHITAGQILGGQQAKHWPYAVAFEFKVMSIGRSICMGTLIAPDVLITAGHCIITCLNEDSEKNWPCDVNLKSVHAMVGAYDLKERENHEPVSWLDVRVNEGFGRFNSDNMDVALIKLAKSFRKEMPCLPPFNDEPEQLIMGQNCTASGWGNTGLGDEGLVRKGKSPLKEINLQVVPMKTCDGPKHSICAKDVAKQGSTCGGDSGTGLVCAHSREEKNGEFFFIHGVLNGGKRTCEKLSDKYVNYFTSLALYHNWIQMVLHEWQEMEKQGQFEAMRVGMQKKELNIK